MDDTAQYSLPHFDEYTETRKPRATVLEGHVQIVYVAAWNPRRDLLATGSADNTAIIWNLGDDSTGKEQTVLPHTLPSGIEARSSLLEVTALDWSNNGCLLATADYEGNARIWSYSGELVNDSLHQHTAPIYAIKWNQLGSYLLTASADGTAAIWDAATGQRIQKFAFHTDAVLATDWKTNTIFATSGADHKIFICELGVDHPIQIFEGHTNEVNDVKWDPQCRFLASGSDDTTIRLWSPERNDCVWDISDAHSRPIYTLLWSPTGPGTAQPTMPATLASASFDMTVRLWDMEKGCHLRTLKKHTKVIYAMAFSGDGRYLATGSFDNYLYIWCMLTGCVVHTYQTTDGIYELAWNRSSTKLAACLVDGGINVLDMRNLWL